MDMINFLHMNGGNGDASYSSNSGLQGAGAMKTKEAIEQAISDLCHNMDNLSKTLVMADLGCSSGPNTLLVASIVINAVIKTSLKMHLESPEVQINLNDLPTNDFNTIFVALQEIKGKILDVRHQPAFYFTGVPGSYYGRLFPMKSLNFVHSSYSLHWLSQQPQLEEINKGNIYLASTTPESVSRAHFEQFQKDFFSFLRCRSEELMTGGRMVLTLAGRTTDDPRDEESNYIWRPLAMAIQEMVYEGHVEEAKFDSFNLPWYNASPKEISNLVKMEGSFTINKLESFDLKWEAWRRKKNGNDASQFKATNDPRVRLCGDVTKAIRAGVEPLVANHFGEAILDDVFMRYEKILMDRKCNKKYESVVSVTVSLTRKM